MERIYAFFRGFLGRRPVPLDSAAFTTMLAERIRTRAAHAEVRETGELQISMRSDRGEEQTAWLGNAYHSYLSADQIEQDGIVEHFVQSFVEATHEIPATPDTVIPVIKDKAWWQGMQQHLVSLGNGKPAVQVFEHLVGSYLLFYAVDSRQNIRYLTEDDFETLGIARHDLKAMAIRNLRGFLPGIEFHRGPLVSMLTAGGSFEASLLLFNDVWERVASEMRGYPVVCAPARDLLLFTDSFNAEGIVQIRELASRYWSEATYPVSEELLIFRDGRFDTYSDS